MTFSFNEKFICNSFDQFIGNKSIKNFVQSMSEQNIRSHIILNGDHGIGKKTLIRLFLESLKKYYHNEIDYYLYFRSSSDRYINSIRSIITSFVRSKVSFNEKCTKFIIFEDSENVTEGIQQIIRSIMDSTSKENLTCIFICNDMSKIIVPLRNKSIILHMNTLNYDDLREKLWSDPHFIISDDPIVLEEIFRNLIKIHNGNLRKIYNSLEYLYVYSINNKITESNIIYSISKYPIFTEVKELFTLLKQNNLFKCIENYSTLLHIGYRPIDILLHFFQIIKVDFSFQNTEIEKCNKCLNIITNTLPKIESLEKTHIQMTSFLCEIYEILNPPLNI